MKFEFNDFNELADYLEFAGYEKHDAIGAKIAFDAACERISLLEARCIELESQIAAAGAPSTKGDSTAAQAYDATTPATAGYCAVDGGGIPTALVVPVQVNAAGLPKRKRRTKAEIEADKAAEAANTPPDESKAPTDAQATAATSPLAGANPFAASTSNEPAATAALNEAPVGATGTLAALAPQGDGEPEGPVDPQSYIALRIAEMGGTFDPREHMKKCIEFIGALGKARYDEAFDLAGTSRAVASYTPADCAKHIAALEYLQIAG